MMTGIRFEKKQVFLTKYLYLSTMLPELFTQSRDVTEKSALRIFLQKQTKSFLSLSALSSTASKFNGIQIKACFIFGFYGSLGKSQALCSY